MILDDDKPDYFLDTDSDSVTQPSGHTESQTRGTIDFNATEASVSTSTADAGSKSCHGKVRKMLALTVFIGAVILGAVFYLRYCTPYVTDARLRCYVVNVEKRGLIFKTFEADVVSESAINDTARLYSRDYSFSIDDAAVASKLQQMQGTGRPVVIDYEKYYGTLPWRGASKSVAVGVESAR